MKNITVTVTGAAGQIGYSLVPRLLSGEIFGYDTKVNLQLVEIEAVLPRLHGTIMELQDCGFDTMGEVTAHSNISEGAENADWALLVGSLPRGIVYNGKKIEERSDLLQINGGIFTEQGAAIGKHAKPDAKILVVGNPANTNCLIGRNAANQPNQLWMAMTALDANRAKYQLAAKLSVGNEKIKNLCVWGNHSPTMYPDTLNATVNGTSIASEVNDPEWIKSDFLPTVQQRGKAVIDARGASSALSAANAALSTVKAVTNKTAEGDCFSAALYGENGYGTDPSVVFGVPLRSDGKGNVSIVPSFEIDANSREYLKITEEELLQERKAVEGLL